MEDFVLQTLNESKIRFDAASIIKIAVVLLLTVAAVVALTVIYKKLKFKPELASDIRRAQAFRVLYRVLKVLVIVTGLIAILQSIGVNFTGLSASFGLAILLAALAVKDALQDIFAGIVIVSDKFFNVGDAVEYEGKEGIVVSFTARTTKIEILEDHSVLSVANRNISQIRKLTHLVDIDLPLSYETGGKKAFALLSGICDKIGELEGVEKCELKGTQDFGASAVIYKIRFFCDPKDRLDIRRAALKTIQDCLEESGEHIPYQQIDIHER